MTPLERTQRYLKNCPPAISGSDGHKTAFSVCCAVVNGFALAESDAFAVLSEWNDTCQPPWSEKELRHKIKDAMKASHDKPRGHLLGPEPRRNGSSVSRHVPASKPPPAVKQVKASYDLADAGELPGPIEDGARLLLKSVFQAGEGIRIVNARLNEEEHEVPDGAGPVLSREEWLRKLDTAKGDPNALFSSSRRIRSGSQPGIYIGVNPMKIGGSKDSDVTDFRHTLFEFDEGLSLEEQFRLYQKSRLPCAAVIYSGGKSVHAWVKIDAKDRTEYDERLKLLYDHFELAGYRFDSKNKNPSRLSRLPFCVRFEKRQELLSAGMGCESFSEWMAEIQADGIGTVQTVKELMEFDTAKDANSILGERWICRGGSCLLIGPSGIGKSSLMVQGMASFAIGRPFLGITPIKPLRVMVIQAENDKGDLAEMMQGVYAGFDLLTDEQEQLLYSNLIFIRDSTHTGFEFTAAVRRLIDKHKPDLVVFDPLLSFIGADISRQEVCSQFLRTWMNPISEATGVAWFCVHHTGKPSNDPKSKKHWQASDHSYAGIGSSELTNWARATMTLEPVGPNAFRLMFSKRGKRAGVTHPDGTPTNTAWLAHAEKGINWEQRPPPSEPEPSEHKGGKPSIIKEIIGANLSSFVAECTNDGEGLRKIACRLMVWWGKEKGEDIGSSTCERAIRKLASKPCLKLRKTPESLYVKGENA